MTDRASAEGLREAHRITRRVYHEETHPSLGPWDECVIWPCALRDHGDSGDIDALPVSFEAALDEYYAARHSKDKRRLQEAVNDVMAWAINAWDARTSTPRTESPDD